MLLAHGTAPAHGEVTPLPASEVTGHRSGVGTGASASAVDDTTASGGAGAPGSPREVLDRRSLDGTPVHDPRSLDGMPVVLHVDPRTAPLRGSGATRVAGPRTSRTIGRSDPSRSGGTALPRSPGGIRRAARPTRAPRTSLQGRAARPGTSAAVREALALAARAPDPVQRFPFRLTAAAPPASGVDVDVAALAPGPELAAVLTAVDPARVSDWSLVEMTDAAVRLTSWAQAVAAHLAGLLAERDSMRVDDLRVVGGPTPDQVAGTELAMRMSWTRSAGTALARRGRAFAGPLAATGDALARGRIDAVRANAVERRLADVPVPVALDVQDAVLPAAPGRTAPQIRTDLERALIEVDPEEARNRHDRARATRRVERPVVLPDGMAALRAVLPAPDAVRVHRVLDAAARTARASGDPRTLDQLRADGLVDLVVHDACTDVDVRTDALTAPADDATPPAPGPAAARDTGPAPDPSTAAGIASRGCRARRRPDTLVQVTVSLPTLLGDEARAAELDGYGPVHPDTARALAAGGVLRRLVTDPVSGALLDLGRTRYRPSAALEQHVRARDRTCRRPGCGAAASTCDLDHTRDFHQRPADGGEPGATSHDNLGALCRLDHRLKSVARFRLRQCSPGRFEWVTPTGHTYAVDPEALGPPDHQASEASRPPSARPSPVPPGSHAPAEPTAIPGPRPPGPEATRQHRPPRAAAPPPPDPIRRALGLDTARPPDRPDPGSADGTDPPF